MTDAAAVAGDPLDVFARLTGLPRGHGHNDCTRSYARPAPTRPGPRDVPRLPVLLWLTHSLLISLPLLVRLSIRYSMEVARREQDNKIPQEEQREWSPGLRAAVMEALGSTRSKKAKTEGKDPERVSVVVHEPIRASVA